MTRSLIFYKLVLRLYPRTWRERYEEEMLVVAASHPFSFGESMDLVRGALDVYLHPDLGTITLPRDERSRQLLLTLRRSLLLTIFASLGALVAGAGFQRLTGEDAALQEVGQTPNLVGLSFHLALLGLLIVFLAVLVGGLPLVLAVIRSAASRKRYGPLAALAVPPLAFVLFFFTTLLLETLDQPGTHAGGQFLLHQGLFFGTALFGVLASCGAVYFVLAQSDLPARLLRFALLPFTLGTGAQLVMGASTLIWGLALCLSAPQLLAGHAGIIRTSTMGTWLLLVGGQALLTTLGVLSLLRGREASRVLGGGQ